MHRLSLLSLLLLAAPAWAQADATSLAVDAPRVLHVADVEVKGPDGDIVVYRYSTTYDPISGEYLRLVTDTADGAVLERSTSRSTMVSPTPEEIAYAKAVIAADTELSGLMDAAEHPVKVEGGFILTREENAPICAPGSRCLQFDIYELVPGQRAARRIRYVVVDMRSGELVARDLDPTTESNFANPATRAQSRSRDLVFPSDSQ